MTAHLHLVPFHEDTLYLVDHDGEPYVPVRPINDALGLSWQRQTQKLSEERWKSVLMCTVAADGKRREMLCLPLRKLPAWLYSISPAKVREDIRPKLERYQEECDEVLWKYWSEGAAVNPRAVVPPAKDFPHHAADRLVAAGRTFREALRSARALGLPQYEAVRKANEAAKRHTGLDVLSELDVAPPPVPPEPEPAEDPSDPGEFLRQWMAGKLPVPYCICRSVDLHRAYELWCLTRGTLPQGIKPLVRAIRAVDYRMAKRVEVILENGRLRRIWKMVVPVEAQRQAQGIPMGRMVVAPMNRFAAALDAWESKVRSGGAS